MWFYTQTRTLSVLVVVFTPAARNIHSAAAPLQSHLSAAEKVSAQQRFQHGRDLMERRKFAEAGEEFREILKSEPNSPLLYNLLGLCALQQNLRSEAVADFQKAVELDGRFKPARTNLGGVYLLEGNFETAQREFLAITRMDPRDAQAHLNLARAELALNRRQAGEH